VLAFRLSGGNVHDSRAFAALLDAVRCHASAPADRAPARTTCSPTRPTAPGNTARCCAAAASRTPSPSPTTRRPTGAARAPPAAAPSASTPPRYARRNTIERGFCQLKQWRGLATRYDKHAANYAAGITIAALLTWLP
jgi:transposase